MKTGSKTSLTGNFRFIRQFPSKFLTEKRDIIVYLPPSYESSPDRLYPVFYIQDGNNLFDEATAFGGQEWHIDETLEDLLHHFLVKEVICVGVSNTIDREFEYTPTSVDGKGGGADLYASFLIDELKPMIDEEFQTKKDAENTGIMGSSLGGLVSLYIGMKYPQSFFMIGALSTSLWWDNGYLFRYLVEIDPFPMQKIAIYIGSEEGRSVSGDSGLGASRGENRRVSITKMVADSRTLKGVLEERGYQLHKDLFFLEGEGEAHNEGAWSRQMDDIFNFFFSNTW